MSRYVFYPLCALSLAVGMILGTAVKYAIQDASLPPCATEDSAQCYWDSDTQGNGLGSDLVNP